jgi:hypothetical protein
MANATPSRVGQIKGAGDVRELFLKVFSGEVMTVFDNETVMKEKVRVRNLSSGKSAQFPAIGTTKAFYHTPGVEITGDLIQHDEKIITIDDLLVAATAISQIDEAMNHYEVRSEYAKRMGQALAQTYDRNLLSLAVKAARDTGAGGIGVGAVGQGNAVSANIGAAPTLQAIVDAHYTAARVFDEKNIPASERFSFVSPQVYWGLVTNDKLIDRDFNRSNGDYAGGSVMEVAGFKIIKTNNLAVNHTAATATYPDYNNKYAVNASDTRALLMHPDALGTVKLLDLASEMEWDIRRQVTLMVSKMAVGHGVLRPECIYELRAAA